MELIGIELSKIVSLFLVSRPSGQPPLGKIGKALQERYQFALFPKTIEEMAADKIIFGHGSFKDIRIDLLELYPDGIVISAKSPTEEIEAFMHDLVSWADENFGLKRTETQTINLVYESHLLIRSEKPLLAAIEPLKGVQSLLKKLLFASTKMDIEFAPFGISFSADPTKLAHMKPSRFSVERKVGPAYETNLYFSAAPLKTSDHLKVLELLESST